MNNSFSVIINSLYVKIKRTSRFRYAVSTAGAATAHYVYQTENTKRLTIAENENTKRVVIVTKIAGKEKNLNG